MIIASHREVGVITSYRLPRSCLVLGRGRWLSWRTFSSDGEVKLELLAVATRENERVFARVKHAGALRVDKLERFRRQVEVDLLCCGRGDRNALEAAESDDWHGDPRLARRLRLRIF